jgi:hypothetical protein
MSIGDAKQTIVKTGGEHTLMSKTGTEVTGTYVVQGRDFASIPYLHQAVHERYIHCHHS